MLRKVQAILSSLLIITGLLIPGIGTALATGTTTSLYSDLDTSTQPVTAMAEAAAIVVPPGEPELNLSVDKRIRVGDAAPTANPDPITGGEVTYLFTITNLSSVEVAIYTAHDTVFDDLTGEFPDTLAAAGTAGDSFTAEVEKTYDPLDVPRWDAHHDNSFYAVIGYGGETKQSETVEASITVKAPRLRISFICYDPAGPSYRWQIDNPTTGNNDEFFYEIGDEFVIKLFAPPGISELVTGAAGDSISIYTRNETYQSSAEAGDTLCPKLEIAKTVGPADASSSDETSYSLTGGGTVKYFFTISNVSDFDLMVSATDTHLEEVAANWPAEGTPLPKRSSVTLPVTKTLPNQTMEETNTFTVTGWQAGGTWTENYEKRATVTVTAEKTPPGDPPDDPPSSPPSSTISGNPDFTVSKLVSTTNSHDTGQSSISITDGGTVYYFYAVTNTGDVPVVITEATDDKLGPISFSPRVINPGQTATATLSKSFSALALGSQPEEESSLLSASVGFNGTVHGPKTASATVINNPLPAGSVTVRVLDNSPQHNGVPVPIANAEVTLPNGLSGQTNANGEIRFNNLPFGSYNASVSSVDPVTGLDPQSGSGSASIDAQNPDEVITLLLSWAPALAGPTPTAPVSPPATRKGSITVLVLDGSSRNNGNLVPIAGAEIGLAGRAGKTDASGLITFDNLDFATYTALAEAVDPTNPAMGEVRRGQGQAEITPAFPHERITIVLMWEAAAAAPASEVPTGNLAGRICAPRDPGAELVAVDSTGATARTFVAATGKLGLWLDYALQNLAPGEWTLTLNSPGHSPAQQKVTIKSGETVVVPDFSLACTGQSGPTVPIGTYYLVGALMVVSGLLLRRFGKVEA